MATTEQLPGDPITAEQRWLIQRCWEKVLPNSQHVAELFYDRLFELDPLLEDSFPSDLAEQGAYLMQALELAVARLEEPGSIAPCLEELGRRHVAYGVRRSDYVTMGRALSWTLEQTLAEDFTRRVQDAWDAVYALLSELLIEAAEAAACLGREPGSGRRPVAPCSLVARRAG